MADMNIERIGDTIIVRGGAAFSSESPLRPIRMEYVLKPTRRWGRPSKVQPSAPPGKSERRKRVEARWSRRAAMKG